MMSSPQLPASPRAPPPPPTFGTMPFQKKPQAKSMTPTFLGSGDIPQAQNLGAKTLLGN